ncbi:amino acid--[acyl-carrier-protein] ligase [Rhodococcus sp. 15-725-2-2b]|uniref:amino acid--[acyl-carrier-protein] ligase n=1 Tax=unclassified Rhodococcus (in: high G+C Gram-positive bacteria) TaxID=192944 RepID=UPI000B9A530D|nr:MULTISPECIES: amino acid--[acyl-carrier-protein] ligase [unclassified Rhodococcus (in: high G+C Gram-positive bacteria)]OZC62573.1 amino acid--[acyl-carrier-protein] ligase [Rhodococcus sp. 06-469-3-2]OZC81156.1 amino acid--[acyl-carrier-protein] ligase [Rhodococcus sp. 06-418-5]OZD50081.1 amino acid--[acyl-carrier-protein] ligase [Rhodococcus sp. 06-1477-1A]OZE76309.1 amino acid--[acyl-carrier-protein] ligase [Rhodococcus sp. 15-725-2-2b]
MTTTHSAPETEISELDSARAAFRAELIDAGLLVPSSIPGLYGRSGEFEDIIEFVDARVTAAGVAEHGRQATRFRFAPVFPREAFERTDYIASFPNLTGAINTFEGDNKAHAELLAERSDGKDWDHFLQSAGTMLVSAACHPSYSMLTGTLPDEGTLMDIYGYCFRHEPAVDPARMQAFRMHEFVRVGTPDEAVAHRERWVPRGLQVLADLGLEAEAVIANDPFFGRAGRMLAANQRNENLKTELVVKLYGDLDEGTAVVSCNCHRDHFGHTFGIETVDGEPAHSACVGFGMERIALAMLRTHGLDRSGWPAALRN